MKIGRWIIVVIFGVLLITIAIFRWPPLRLFDKDFPPEKPEWLGFLPYLLFAKTILSSVNAVFLTVLLALYIGIYRNTGSEFSMGLVIFSIALLFYSITSNPLIHRITGFKGSGLGPFVILPDLFTFIASAVLLYLSQQ